MSGAAAAIDAPGASGQRRADARPRRVTVLGSTGSIGHSTLDLLGAQPRRFHGRGADREPQPGAAGRAGEIASARALPRSPTRPTICALKDALAGTGIEVAAGRAALVEAAERPADWVMAGIVGAAGLEPTLAAVRRGRIVAFANKEVLVCAGTLFMQEVATSRRDPLAGRQRAQRDLAMLRFRAGRGIEKITLTCSGGPFRERSLEEMRDVTAEAGGGPSDLAHGRQDLGRLGDHDEQGAGADRGAPSFQLPPEQIDIVVHPQSIIHGAGRSISDGSVLAQLGSPDMRTPIAYALGWPGRTAAPMQRLDLAAIGRLTFEAPDDEPLPGAAAGARGAAARRRLPRPC